MIGKKNMTLLFIGFVLIVVPMLFFILHVLLGKANPPLPQTQITIQSSTADTASTSVSSVQASSLVVAGENAQLGTTTMKIDGATFTVEIASTTLQKANGLSFRKALDDGQGMLFLFGSGSVQSFWMKDMHFSLDIIWINGTRIVGISHDVPAPASGTALWNLKLYSSPENTDKVLEVPAGTTAKFNIKVGDTVKIE